MDPHSFGSSSAPPAAPHPLPVSHAWRVSQSPTGLAYYFNFCTGFSTYEKPLELMDAAERIRHACPWREYPASDFQGLPYYHNATTRRTSWVMPPQYRAMLAQLHAEGLSEAPAPNAPQLSAEQQRAVFFQMCAEQRVHAAEMWHQAVIRLDEDPRFSLIETPEQRLEFFSQFQQELSPLNQNTLSSSSSNSSSSSSSSITTHPTHGLITHNLNSNNLTSSSSIVNATQSITPKQAFMALIKEALGDLRISLTSSWRDARPILQEDPRFGAEREFPDPAERELVFEELLMHLHKMQQQDLEQRNKADRRRFRDFLRASEEITAATLWRDFSEEAQRQHPWIAALPLKDKLELFRSHVQQLEKEDAILASQAEKRAQQEARRLRAAFKQRLHADYHALRVLDAFYPWQKYRALLERSGDAVYAAMVGKPGSDARDLFLDFVDGLHARYWHAGVHAGLAARWEAATGGKAVKAGRVGKLLKRVRKEAGAEIAGEEVWRVFEEWKQAQGAHPEVVWGADERGECFTLNPPEQVPASPWRQKREKGAKKSQGPREPLEEGEII